MPPRVVLISTYELGRPPFGLASPAAWLREAGCTVQLIDASRQGLDEQAIASSDLVAFYLPMHTATRLAAPLIERVRRINPRARLCAYGLYAPPNAAWLQALGIEAVLGGEFEADLVALACGGAQGQGAMASAGHAPAGRQGSVVPRLRFRVPDRRGLPPLSRYAALDMGDGTRRLAGYTEASRGCKHRCRHCPVVPVYQGHFRIVPVEVVLADIRAQVEAGAQHISFGDPDFFNGIGHALRVVEEVARTFPGLTYDVTVKIAHLLRYARHLETLARTGCLFVTSAVECFDDGVLARLEKGHTQADVERAVALCRQAGLALVPTFIPFHPWTSVSGYCALLERIVALDLVDHVAPVQLAIRLLIPEGSRLLELAEVRRLVEPFDPQKLTYPWRHPDPAVDALQQEVLQLVGAAQSRPRRAVFRAVWSLAHERAGRRRPLPAELLVDRAAVPFLTEPWYC
jgi:radical SAM superfamily enzyme YgiQ (UPF0313 family)